MDLDRPARLEGVDTGVEGPGVGIWAAVVVLMGAMVLVAADGLSSEPRPI